MENTESGKLNIDLQHGDCLKLMKNIPDGSVDMVLCDLPYGVTACSWDSVLPLDVLWKEYERIIKSNGIIVLFGTEPFASKVRMSNIKRYKYDWIWEKEQSPSGLFCNERPMNVHENIMVFYSSDIMNDTTLFFKKSKDYLISEKEKAEAAGYNMREVLGNYMASHYFTRKTQFAFPKREDYEKLQSTGFFKREYDEAKRMTYNPQMTEGKPYKAHTAPGTGVYNTSEFIVNENTGTRYPRSVIKISRERGYHPTQKPVPLLEYLIKTYTNPGETVLDNTMGSGSTGVACVNTGRSFIGIELDDNYYDIAVKRIHEAEEANG